MPSRSPIAVVSLLALTHLLTIVLLIALLLLFRFDATGYFAVLGVPLGTLVFGIVGSLGAVAGARLVQYPPEAALRTMMVAAAVIAYALYLLIVAGLASRSSADHPGVLATLFQMSGWGYLQQALEFVGVIVGAVATHGTLRLLPYCASCRVFTCTREKGTLYFRSIEAWATAMRQLPAEPWLRARQILQLPRQKLFSLPGRHYVLVHLRRHECPGCLQQHMRERVLVHDGRVQVEQKQLSSVYSWPPSQARSQPQPVEQQPPVRGFGRKVA